MPVPQRLSALLAHGEGLGDNLHRLVQAHDENLRLHKKIDSYRHREHRFFQLAAENERFRELLAFKEHRETETIPTRIIGREPQRWFKSFLIDKGTADGIKENAPVIAVQADREGLIGRVLEVSEGTAKVLLLTDELSAVAVTCRRSGDDGIVQGQNRSQLLFDYIVPDGDITVGDTIVTSNVSGVFPPGLLIGHVSSIAAQPEGYFRKAQIATVIDYHALKEVLVLRKESP